MNIWDILTGKGIGFSNKISIEDRPPWPIDTAFSKVYMKYLNLDPLGADAFRSIINYRAAAIAGSSIKFSSKDKIVQTKIDEVLSYVNYKDIADTMALFSEIEGAVLVLIDKKNDEIKIEPVLRNIKDYTLIESDGEITGLKIKGEEYKGKFVFIKTSGLPGDNKNYCPPIGYVGHHIERIADALADRRRANRIHAKPSIKAIANTTNGIESVRKALTGFSPGDAVVVHDVSELGYFETSGSADAVLEKEITMNLKFVVGYMAVPIHHVGFVDLFGTKAGAEGVSRVTSIGTRTERTTMQNGHIEIMKKCIELLDGAPPPKLDITVSVAESIEFIREELVNFWLPLTNGGHISGETLWEHIPDIDTKQEAERLKNQKENNKVNFGVL